MATRRVRIYSGPKHEYDVVGFSLSAYSAPDNPAFARFMEERGYSWQETDRPHDSVSHRNIEVRPPLSEEHLRDFGTLCIGGMIDGKRVGAIVDPYHDGTIVVDNRHITLGNSMMEGILLANN